MSSPKSQTRLLLEHASNLISSSNIKEIAEHSLDIMENVIKAELCSFQILEEKCLKMLGNRPSNPHISLSLDGPGVTVKAANSRETVLIHDIEDISYFYPGWLQTRSELAVPILIDEQLFGVINIEDREPNLYTEHTVELMEALASQIAIAVKSLKRFQAIKSIQDYTRDFIRRQSFSEIAELTFQVLKETINVSFGSFHVVEGNLIDEIYTVGSVFEPFNQELNGKGVVPRTYRTKKTQNVSDVSKDPDYVNAIYTGNFQMKSELAVPIIHNHNVIAVVNLEDVNLNRFSIDDQLIVEIIADIISVWYENKLLMEKNLSNQSVETRYRHLFELTPLPILIFDPLGFVTSCNEATLQLTDYTRDYIIGKHLSEITTFKPEVSKVVLANLYQIASGHDVDRLEFEFTTRDGVDKWGTAYGRLIDNPTGSQELLVLVEDITEAKKREEDRLIFETRIAEERIKAEQAMEMDRMKTSFISTATHEIRTPLTSIVGYMELVDEAINRNKIEQGLHYFDPMKRNINRLSIITDNLLDLQRFQRNRVELDIEDVSISSLIEEVLEEIEPLKKVKHIRINTFIKVNEEIMQADRIRTNQVLINLLNNSVKFTPEAGIIKISVTETGDEYLFSVSDNGIGLSKTELEKLFEPFPDINPTRGKGTGIGLSICKGNVELHGGRIWAESPGEGKGSTFHFTIPKSPQDPL